MDIYQQHTLETKRTKKKKSAKKMGKENNHLVGFRGWLAFFVVGYTLGVAYTVVRYVLDGSLSQSDVSELNEYQSGLGDALMAMSSFENIAVITYIIFGIVTLVLLYLRRKSAKIFAISTLTFVAVYGIIDYILVMSIFESSNLAYDAVVEAELRTYRTEVGRNITGAFIWIPYLLASKRVKATLTQTPDNTATLKTLEKEDNSNHYSSHTFFLGRRIFTIVAISFVAIIALGLIANSTGGQFFNSKEVVVQEYQPETFREEATGNYNVTYTERWICGGGEDYLSCLNSHVAIYNTVCANRSLTLAAESICSKLNSFIADIKVRHASCGYGCRTIAGGDGRWGWQYLDVSPETRQVSNNDEVEEVTRTARCFIHIGIISVGECRV